MAGALAGKVGLITGGASGIGRATALAFAAEGARVVVADINPAGAAATAKLIEAAGGEALGVQADVSDAASVEALIRAAVAAYGHLDCAFNNAGVSQYGSPIPEIDEAVWDRVMRVNLRSVFLCMKYEIPRMAAQGGGAIVNTASGYGLKGARGNAAYVASKHGVVGLTKVAALENAERGVRVNSLCPGWTETPLIQARLDDPDFRARILASEPMGRPGRPEEIAAAVVWLCSDAASFVTGHAMSVDGGFLQQ
jgi:NAD(P)-dependent dehydrogenase (short-subunit alcohol dehydrogenase family)